MKMVIGPAAPKSIPGHAMLPGAVGDSLTRESVIGTDVDVVEWSNAIDRVRTWASNAESRYVCFSNVHALVTARLNSKLSSALSQSDLVAADGAPVAWMLRRLGHSRQPRINGPDFFWKYCAAAATKEESIFLLGGNTETLTRLQQRIRKEFPALRIAGASSPPYRALSEEEDRAIVAEINASGASTVWVSLGCPKQEIWMAAHRGSVHAVMLGVGAAFNFYAGTEPMAPNWMRESGLEWFHRLCSDPRRLWRRYLVTNTLFLLLGGSQLLKHLVRRSE